MGYRGVIIMFFLAFLTPFTASAACFSRDLSSGTEGADVKKLQEILNASVDTRVSATGAGAPGQESMFFGSRTKAAVVRFQEKHAKDVLLPAGLSTGTGYVGRLTRSKLEWLCEAVKPIPPPSSAATGSASKQVYVMRPSHYSGVPGAAVTIAGDGFLFSGNTVKLGAHAVGGSFQHVSAISFIVPAIAPGRYPLWVENASGKSNTDAFFIVRDPNVPEPVITSFDPPTGFPGEKVRIVGTGFLPSGNEIRSGTNLVSGVPSDGTRIEWTPPAAFGGGSGTGTLPVWVYIVNDTGVSNPLVFELKV